jgi:hypothetical protein
MGKHPELPINGRRWSSKYVVENALHRFTSMIPRIVMSFFFVRKKAFIGKWHSYVPFPYSYYSWAFLQRMIYNRLDLHCDSCRQFPFRKGVISQWILASFVRLVFSFMLHNYFMRHFFFLSFFIGKFVWLRLANMFLLFRCFSSPFFFVRFYLFDLFIYRL